MIACRRNVRTGIFVGSFFSIIIFCIIVWKIIFGCNITNNADLSIYKTFLCIRDPGNSTWIDFYIKKEVLGKSAVVLKRNLRIEGMNNDEIINYYHNEFPESLSTQNSNTISYKDGRNHCLIRNEDNSLEVSVIRR